MDKFLFENGYNNEPFNVFDGDVRVHPNAQIQPGTEVGAGSTIYNATLGIVSLGEGVIVGNYTILEDDVVIGNGSRVWHFCHLRKGVHIGNNCNLGNYVFIDSGVVIGDETKIQNYVPVYHGVQMEEGVFLGPNSLTTNDMNPRARTDSGEPKAGEDWVVSAIFIGKDASIGAGAVLRPGVKIGERALIGAGAVVTKDVPPGAIVVGNPARILRYQEGFEPK